MIKKKDPRPLYLIVKDNLLELINKGYYSKGSKLPSEFELAKEFGVSRPTLREALRVLEEDNVLVRSHGIGTFVKENNGLIQSGIEQLHSVTESIKQRGLDVGTTVLSVEVVEPSKKDQEKLNIHGKTPIIKIERVRTADDEPVVFCIDKLIKRDFEVSDFENIENSIFDLLEKNYNQTITYAVSEIVPVLANYKLANALSVPARSPLLLLEQTHYTADDTSILYSKNYFRADKFSFHVVKKRS